jgi:uncharacterized protein (DUF2267 family)
MTHEQFVNEVIARTGLEHAEADRVIQCCLRALAEGLSDLPIRRVRGQLPPEEASWLTSDGDLQSLTVESFCHRCAALEGVRPGLGLEHGEVVLQTVYASLDEEARRLLAEDLPSQLLDMASSRPSYHPPSARPIPLPRTMRRASSGTSLAEGHERSRSPVSEAGKIPIEESSEKGRGELETEGDSVDDD